MAGKTFRLGILESVLRTRLEPVRARLKAACPMTVTVGHSRDLFKRLKAGEFDAIFAIDCPEDPGIRRAKAFGEDVMLIYPDSHCPVESASDLEDLPMAALPEGCSYRRRLLAWMDSQGAKPLSVEDQPDYASILRAVASGGGFAPVPASVLSASDVKSEIQADRLEGPEGRVWVELLWRPEAPAQGIAALRSALGF